MIEKEVEYSKEIDSNSSFSVFQSLWMSARLKEERHRYILLELRLPFCKAPGSFGDPPPPLAPGEIRIQALSLAVQENSGRLIPRAEDFPLNSSLGSAFSNFRAGGLSGRFS